MILIISILYIIWSALCVFHWHLEDLDTKPLPYPIFTWFLVHSILAILFFLIKIL